jgi:hypothetical protein
MFHELIHMASGAGDKGYSKRECYNLARTDPEKARMNSAAYVFFAMESGLPSKEKYEEYSRGASILNEGCVDRYSNCFELAKGCCNGNNLSKSCCASCTYFDKTPLCKKRLTCSD